MSKRQVQVMDLKTPNIFQILKITKSKGEKRHSNFLSWLLDPNKSHKLGDSFLKRFLEKVFSSDKFPKVDQSDVEDMDLTKVEIKREWEYIDILIKHKDFVVCVENKVEAPEVPGQLTKYKDTIEKNFPDPDYHRTFVYLTPDGDSPENETESYEPISYKFIAESLESIISVDGESLNERARNYIEDYITIIKPEPVDDLRRIMKEEVPKRGWILGSKAKNFVRFLTPKIKPLIYHNQKCGWVRGKKESFLFQIRLSQEGKSNEGKSNFETAIPLDLEPGPNSDYSKRLEDILCKISGFEKSNASTKSTKMEWLKNREEKEPFNYGDIRSMSDDDLGGPVNKFFDEITPIIKQVEEKFLEHEEELLDLKKQLK